MSKKVLVAGESWMSFTTHVKGFDTFYTSVYEEGAGFLISALESSGYEVEFMPNHAAPVKFPDTLEKLNQYECVILSDIGSNTLLLAPETFAKSIKTPNRCQLLKEYVQSGGALLMIGGYMSFSGVDSKARYGQTEVKDVLPVKCLDYDDRQEHPEGIVPVKVKEHPAISALPAEWPHLLGYNKTLSMPNHEVLMTVAGDPLIAVGEFGKGRSAVFTSDCGPHWGPMEFVNWKHYNTLWKGLMDYLTER